MKLRRTALPARRDDGYTLVEMMVALVIASLTMIVLLSVLLSASRANQLNAGLSTLQENARFALATIARDVRVAGGQFCLNFNGRGSISNPADVQAGEPVRGIWANFDATVAPWRLGRGPMAAPYWTEPSSLVRGFECDTTGSGTCTPAVDTQFPAFTGAPLPNVGIADGARARGSDVLFVRSLAGDGIRVIDVRDEQSDSIPAVLQLEADASALGLGSNGAVLVSDCSLAAAARVTASGSTLLLNGNFNDDVFPSFEVERQARVFNLSSDLVDVTYFLAIRELPPSTNNAPRKVSSLIRRSGGTDAVVADGIERFDLLYHVELSDGRVAVLNAQNVDALTPANCREWTVPAGDVTSASPCGWRSLVGVEIHLLADTVDPIDHIAASEAFRYSWRNDGAENVLRVYEDPSTLATLANGLPPGRTPRREFQTFVSIRGYNP